MARKPRGSGKKAADPISWSDAPEVQEVAAKLISDHHSHLTEARVKYIFRGVIGFPSAKKPGTQPTGCRARMSF